MVGELPSEHARSSLEAFWLWTVMASMQRELGRIVYVGAKFPHQICFCSCNESLDYIEQNWPGSDLNGLVRFWPKRSGP